MYPAAPSPSVGELSTIGPAGPRHPGAPTHEDPARDRHHRGEHSQTLPFSRAFLGHLAKVRPDLTVQDLDLSTTTLPTIDDTIASTKYRLMQGLPVDRDAAKTWPFVEALIDDFVSADLCLITTPMWNFGLPHQLKH